jgi:small subunit ribosomal protein S6
VAARGKKTAGAKKTARQAKKTEGQQLRDYEMVLVISPELADERLDTTIKNISQIITDVGGVVSDIKQWGKRKLAYPIKRFSEGNYVLAQLQLQPALSKEVESKLQISEEVLRHLLVRLNS